MPTIDETPQLTVYRNGHAKLNDRARRTLLGVQAVLISAPSTIGGRWQLLPLTEAEDGAATLYEDRGQRRFSAYALATALFALLPAAQKTVRLALEPGTAGYRLAPSGEVPDKSARAA
jgi:hypothetical protein